MFSYLVVRDWEDFTFRGDLLYWGTFFIFREKEGGGLDLFFHKNINDQSCNLKNSWWQNYVSCVYANFSHFYLGMFCLRIFCLFKVSIQTLKSVHFCLAINLWKCECCLIWAQNKSILLGSNSLVLSVSIMWYILWKKVLVFRFSFVLVFLQTMLICSVECFYIFFQIFRFEHCTQTNFLEILSGLLGQTTLNTVEDCN